MKLNHKFADKVGADLALMTKERPAQQVAEIGYVIGDVKGKTAVIVDDIIDTAGTLRAAAQTVLDEGAARVYAAATHGLFSGNALRDPRRGAVRADRRHRHGPAAPGAPDNVVVLSLAGVLADSIRQISTGGSVSRG